MYRSTTLACFVVVTVALAAMATSVIPLTFDQLTAKADHIVRFQVAVAETEPGEFLQRPALVTHHSLETTAVYKGASLKTLTLFGGRMGEHVLRLEGQPELKAGDEVIAFLTDAPIYCPFVGIWQGVFYIRQGTVWRGTQPVVDIVKGQVALGADNDYAMAAADFEREIRTAMAKAAVKRSASIPAPVEGR